MGIRRSYDESMLAQLRWMPSELVLRQLSIQVKADCTFMPRKSRESRRWHVLTERGDLEILTTGRLWFDTRERRGGGSAVDLAMHLLGVSFVDAVRRLSEERLPANVGGVPRSAPGVTRISADRPK
jgi:hypothetical protein